MPNADLVKETLRPLLNELDVRDRTMIELRFGLTTYPRTLEETGEQCGLHRERVRRIEADTLKQLRASAGPLLFSALVQEAADLREALIEEHGAARRENLPSRVDSPWRDLALGVCGVSTESWISFCVGKGSAPVT